MTPFGHLATTLAAGGVAQPALRKLTGLTHRAIVGLFLVSSLIPDVDGLPLLWSWKAYHGTYWYSHHMLGHSLLGAVGWSLLLGTFYILGATIFRGVRNFFRRDKVVLEHRLRKFIAAFLIAYLGCLAHFLGDMIAPPGPWKGLALFWPSKEMYGGWSRVYWHNHYIIYISTVFTIAFLIVQAVAGGIQSLRAVLGRFGGYALWGGRAVRAVGVLLCAVFLYQYMGFIGKYDYKQLGYNRWQRLNQSLIPKSYKKLSGKHMGKFTVFWRKRLITHRKFLLQYHATLSWLREKHRKLYPTLEAWLPNYRSAAEDLRLYRALQRVAPGMEDSRTGKYRVWIVRMSEPDPKFFDRAISYYYVSSLREHVMQMSNAVLIAFRIEKRDAKGRATKVTRVFHSDKVQVPGEMAPQINQKKMHYAIFYHQFFLRHDRIAYNAIPGLDYSRYMVLNGGFFPSYTYRTGVIWPGRKTGVYLHAGVWGEGCIIASYGHANLGEHLRFPFYRLWETADENIDITKRGVKVRRGQTRLWGRMMFVKDAARVKRALAEVDRLPSRSTARR